MPVHQKKLAKPKVSMRWEWLCEFNQVALGSDYTEEMVCSCLVYLNQSMRMCSQRWWLKWKRQCLRSFGVSCSWRCPLELFLLQTQLNTRFPCVISGCHGLHTHLSYCKQLCTCIRMKSISIPVLARNHFMLKTPKNLLLASIYFGYCLFFIFACACPYDCRTFHAESSTIEWGKYNSTCLMYFFIH